MLLLFQMLQVHTLYCLFRNNNKKEERKRQKNKKNLTITIVSLK